MIGTTLGSYSIQKELGRGGMGAVYVGVHALLGRQAAVKVLLPEFSRNQDIVNRFFNEARAATAIKHPGIVEIYDFGYTAEGLAFIVMEFLQGESLSARLRHFGRLTPAFALAVIRQCAGALAVAHRAGIVHRDLKPDNVFLVPDPEVTLGERIKLLDFGIAKLASDPAAGMARTSTGAIMGTPYYMSPEQCRGAGHVDHRSDLYALGCMLFEMLTGRVPFGGEGAGEIIAAHIHVAPPSLRALAPEVPPEVEELVMRLLAKVPDQRPATADVVVQEIGAMLQRLGLAVSNPAVATSPGAVTRVPASPSPTTLGSAAGQATAPVAPRRTGLVIGIAAVVLAAGAAAAFVMSRGGSSEPKAGAPPAPIDAGKAAAVAVDATLEQELAGEAVRLLADARKAVDAESWEVAAHAARGALALEPSSVEAQAIIDEADLEGPAKAQMQMVLDAKTRKDHEAAVAAFEGIPADSRYRGPMAAAMDELRGLYFEEIVPKVEAYVKRGRCKDAQKIVGEASALWATQAAPLQAVVKKCKATVAGSGSGSAAGSGSGSGSGEVEAEVEVEASELATKLNEEGKEAMFANQYQKALGLFDRALKLAPRHPKFRYNAATAAYQLGEFGRALKYIDGVNNAKANKLRKVIEDEMKRQRGGGY